MLEYFIIASPMNPEEIKKITLQRLEEMPLDKEIIINSRPYHRDELVEHVEKEDEIGQKMMLKQSKITKALTSNGVWY